MPGKRITKLVSSAAFATHFPDSPLVLSLFFVPEIEIPQTFVLGDEAHHIHKVLRMSVGESLLLSDGRGKWAQGNISTLSKAGVVVEISKTEVQSPLIPKISVIQAVPKSDRIKETIELLTEAGVDQIIPWQATRSISKLQNDSLEKWRLGAFAAAKQSRRFFIPEITFGYSPHSVPEGLFQNSLIVTCHESSEVKLSQVFKERLPSTIDTIFIVIGPEGGLTEEEVVHFQSFGAHTVRMGEPIFRSAHAGGVVLAAIQALIGRW